jgi:hypothetical protein
MSKFIEVIMDKLEALTVMKNIGAIVAQRISGSA